jgi:hypothetical protein
MIWLAYYYALGAIFAVLLAAVIACDVWLTKRAEMKRARPVGVELPRMEVRR